MKFRIVYTKRSAKDISGLAPDAKDRLKKALERYSEAPLHYARKMADPSLGNYRFRIGDYRVMTAPLSLLHPLLKASLIISKTLSILIRTSLFQNLNT